MEATETIPAHLHILDMRALQHGTEPVLGLEMGIHCVGFRVGEWHDEVEGGAADVVVGVWRDGEELGPWVRRGAGVGAAALGWGR